MSQIGTSSAAEIFSEETFPQGFSAQLSQNGTWTPMDPLGTMSCFFKKPFLSAL
jgi:hypothetical protein